MELACRRATELGLPSIAFTDHADFTTRRTADDVEPPQWQRHLVADQVLAPPALDVTRYFRGLEACRQRFPHLRIRSGVELGEPHHHRQRVAELLGRHHFERVLASVHALPAGTGHVTVDAAYRNAPPDEVVRRYLREVHEMIERFDGFEVLAHIDYAARFRPHEPADFEDEYRAVLATLADRGKVLEINTRIPLAVEILRWWRDAKGDAVTFGSDAHRTDDVARNFGDAAALAESAGFRPGSDPSDLWTAVPR